MGNEPRRHKDTKEKGKARLPTSLSAFFVSLCLRGSFHSAPIRVHRCSSVVSNQLLIIQRAAELEAVFGGGSVAGAGDADLDVVRVVDAAGLGQFLVVQEERGFARLGGFAGAQLEVAEAALQV